MLDRLPRLQGLIGAGTMGSLMAGCLLDAGVTLKVYDRRRAATEALVERGAIRAETAAEAATGCAIVWVSLPGPAEVTSVLLDEDAAVISAMSNYAVLVDTTTNDPEVARQVAAAAAKRGIAMLDAPVSGRPPTMTLMAGGDRADFHKAQPALEAVAAQVFYAGPSGAGCVAKLATQYMAYTNLIAAIEGMLIGQMGGVDPGVLAEIVPASAAASRAFGRIPESVLSRTFAAGGTLNIVAKDMALACQLAERVNAPANTGGVANMIYEAAKDVGFGEQGYPVVARILETMAGTELAAEE